jgi:hypothetical protein
MVKENGMNSVKFAFAAVTALALTACSGQNPVKRESNPVREFPKVAESIQKGEGAVPFGTRPSTEDNSKYACHGPFAISSNSPEGKAFSFAEGSNIAFTIQILNRLGDEFEASVSGLPEGADFRLLSKDGKNAATYQLSWTPKPGFLGTQPSFRTSSILRLKSKQVSERCKTDASETLNLFVEKTQDRPSVAVEGLPQTEIKFGSEVKFNIDVIDTQATAQKTPVLSLGFDAADAANENEKLINGSESVICDKNSKQQEDGQWRFNCKFLSAGLQKSDDEGLVNSGKSAVAVFTVQAKSRVSEKQSSVVKARVKVLFEKVQQQPVAQNQPAAPAPKVETKKTVTPPAKPAPTGTFSQGFLQ